MSEKVHDKLFELIKELNKTLNGLAISVGKLETAMLTMASEKDLIEKIAQHASRCSKAGAPVLDKKTIAMLVTTVSSIAYAIITKISEG